ncbi:MAG: type I-MYXAN CRISPR-associated protein Cas6/Cmx6 [Rhodocyclales bacterium]|nr:type I-MYXAN CRISPR-associated protein Cas6/Cmx6 [Rhodocyclales bacterium]
MSGGDSDVVDLVFGLRGRAIALDYADRLWRELSGRLPWLAEDASIAVHPLAGVSRGNTEIYLTRRARLSLRLRRELCVAASALEGATLDLGGEVEVVGAPSMKMLQTSTVLYSPFVAIGITDEVRFMAACAELIAGMGVSGELIAGRARGGDGGRQGYSLMIHGLKPEHSLQVQRTGLGNDRRRGCGIFVPHKSLAAVDE